MSGVGTFARRVFLVAGLYGILVLMPQFFMEQRIGKENPPAITHPEYFYGFAGVALAFQVVFFVISRDPCRYRAAMIPSILEKMAFFIPCVVLFSMNRLGWQMFGAGMIDFTWGVLFTIAFIRTPANTAA